MEAVALATLAIKFGTLVAAVVALWMVLRLWNALSGDKFDQAYTRIIKNPMAAAVYLSVRFLALAMLVGLVVF